MVRDNPIFQCLKTVHLLACLLDQRKSIFVSLRISTDYQKLTYHREGNLAYTKFIDFKVGIIIIKCNKL